jgi:hypothetical protein
MRKDLPGTNLRASDVIQTGSGPLHGYAHEQPGCAEGALELLRCCYSPDNGSVTQALLVSPKLKGSECMMAFMRALPRECCEKMRCETCQGTGKASAAVGLVGGRRASTQFEWVSHEMLCWDCGGTGIAHCCEGDRPNEKPEKSPLARL